MKANDLEERVARAMHEADDYYVSTDQARAAIAVALEEVAVMLDELGDSPIMADTTAAAIRAMVPQNLP